MSIAACAALVERADPDRFLAAMAAPVAARAVLFPIYAFNVEVTRAPWASKEAIICEMRLQWWRDALTGIGVGDTPRAHEVVTPLAAAIGGKAEVIAPLDALVAARSHDIYLDGFETEADFRTYLQDTAGGLMWAAACALGSYAGAEEAVRQVGWASGLATYFRAIPDLEARGRRPLADGRPEAIVRLAQQGLDGLDRARRTGLPPEARPAARAGWRAQGILTRALKEPRRVADGSLEDSEFARRASLLSRSAFGRW